MNNEPQRIFYDETVSRKEDLQILLAEVKNWGPLPSGWRMQVADSSIHFSNFIRTKSLKLDVYRIINVDRINKSTFDCVSQKIKCSSLLDTVGKAKILFTELTNESTVKSKSRAKAQAPQTAARTRVPKAREERKETANPSWWVLI